MSEKEVKSTDNPAGEAAATSTTTATGPTTEPSAEAAPVLAAADDLTDDADSSLGDDGESSTASITSSILKYRSIHGRTYHSEIGNAQYWGTNDERHSESLDVLHHLFTLCLDDQLYMAPISDPQKVLDIGTGTGIWAIDFGDKWPQCEVIGTDISPMQPTWVPPNVKFEIDDCTQEWTFGANSVDFIHIRYLQGCIADWTAFFQQAFNTIKPGGWLESYEASPNVFSDDGTMPADCAIAQWGPLFVNGGKAIGRSFTIVDDNIQRKAMEEVGFVDIQEKLIKVPSGGWPADPKLKEIGIYAQHAIESDVEGFILFMTNVLGWSREEVIVYIARLRRELRSLKHHVCYWQKVVWGRKPEKA